jgi:hypothetical protein
MGYHEEAPETQELLRLAAEDHCEAIRQEYGV